MGNSIEIAHRCRQFGLWTILLIIISPIIGCSSAPAPRGESIAHDESMTPADFGAMMTGSWYVENEDRRGMATLGGLLSYDMTTSQMISGQKVGEDRVSAGPLWIAGRTESRAITTEGTDGKSNWFFPFWRYREVDGKKTLYPLMVIPIPLGSVDPVEEVASDDEFDPWAGVTEETVVEEYIPEPVETPVQVTRTNSPLSDSSTPMTYRIRKGDTLWSLAVRFYGDGQRYADLIAANQTTIIDPSDMRIGSTIVIPQ